MKNLNYSELSVEAQKEAIRQVMRLHPIDRREKNISYLLDEYEYNVHGEVMGGEPYLKEPFGGQGGDEPEWREY